METNEQQQNVNNQQQNVNEIRSQLGPLTDAITILTNQVEEVQAQNQHILDENRELKSQVRERINTIPMEVKAVLNLFIQEFKEAMASKKPSDMSESIKELAKAMDNLRMKIEDTSVLQLTMSDKVLEAAEEIMQIKDQLPRHAPPKTVAQ